MDVLDMFYAKRDSNTTTLNDHKDIYSHVRTNTNTQHYNTTTPNNSIKHTLQPNVPFLPRSMLSGMYLTSRALALLRSATLRCTSSMDCCRARCVLPSVVVSCEWRCDTVGGERRWGGGEVVVGVSQTAKGTQHCSEVYEVS